MTKMEKQDLQRLHGVGNPRHPTANDERFTRPHEPYAYPSLLEWQAVSVTAMLPSPLHGLQKEINNLVETRVEHNGADQGAGGA